MFELFVLFIVVVVLAGIIFAVVQTGAQKSKEQQKRAAQQQVEAILEKARHEKELVRLRVTERYDPETAARILKNEIWQSMTAEQLIDSAGKPDEIQRTVTKRVDREVWKYDSWGMRVTVEKGVVVGWKEKK